MAALHVGITQLFQSTLSVRRATQETDGCSVYYCISIHALREESDVGDFTRYASHAFQSTLSVRRATWPHMRLKVITNFNPRSP